uniref:Secreted protein n=1 Tax=Panagrolaimus superbus TaxID=310955 RepID=A0A914YML3_9BILA
MSTEVVRAVVWGLACVWFEWTSGCRFKQIVDSTQVVFVQGAAGCFQAQAVQSELRNALGPSYVALRTTAAGTLSTSMFTRTPTS